MLKFKACVRKPVSVYYPTIRLVGLRKASKSKSMLSMFETRVRQETVGASKNWSGRGGNWETCPASTGNQVKVTGSGVRFLCEILRVSDEIRKATTRGDHAVKLRHKFISLRNMWRHSCASNRSSLNNKGNTPSSYIVKEISQHYMKFFASLKQLHILGL